MKRRALLALLLAAALAPGTWLRSPIRPLDFTQALTLTALRLAPGCCTVGPLHLTGAWHLTSPHQQFGGYSALVRPIPGRLLAISDAGYTLDFPEPGLPGAVKFSSLFPKPGWHKSDRDTESAQWDPASRRLWVAAEGSNMVLRFDANLTMQTHVAPPAMHLWPSNTGPEAMARLNDGRFVVLCECRSRWHDRSAYPALLFAGDPTEHAGPQRFFVTGPWDYRPTDMATLPDGRVLVLQRRLIWPFPMRFGARLALLDPREIRPGAVVPLTDLGEFPAQLPMDNYEGLALEPLGGSRYAAWVISDDNAAVLQRTLLLAFEFDLRDLPPTQKAPG